MLLKNTYAMLVHFHRTLGPKTRGVLDSLYLVTLASFLWVMGSWFFDALGITAMVTAYGHLLIAPAIMLLLLILRLLEQIMKAPSRRH